MAKALGGVGVAGRIAVVGGRGNESAKRRCAATCFRLPSLDIISGDGAVFHCGTDRHGDTDA